MLNDGYKMPLFGLGVYRALGEEGKQAVKFALQNGYRMIDTAAFYGWVWCLIFTIIKLECW